MYVFKSDLLDKQINSNNRKDIVNRLNKIITKLFKYDTISQLELDKDLGFKKYKGKNYRVYGIDLGHSKSSSMSGERLIVSFITQYDISTEIFRNTIDEDINKISVLMHFFCKHDMQNKKASLINKNYINGLEYIPVEFEFSNYDINIIEKEICYGSKFQRLVYDDYEKQTITVLSMDKYNIVNSFANYTKPTIIAGIAGSGKTETIIKIMRDLTTKDNSKKIAYVTYSDNLVCEVMKKCETFEHDNIKFYSLKSLLRELNSKNNLEFENIKIFEDFLEEYKMINNGVDYYLKKELTNFIDKNETYKIYSEIYGIIMGCMLDDWNRTCIEKISNEEYNNLLEGNRIFNGRDVNIIYSLTDLYIKYLKIKGITSYNIESMKCNMKNLYDYVLIDEIQDLTECQIKMLIDLSNNKNNLLLCGDIKQIVNPTFFNFGRLKKLFYNLEKSIYFLNSNFRNSKNVTDLINEVNKIRNEKLPAHHVEDRECEESKNITDGNIYYYVGNKRELIEALSDANTAIIVDEIELEKYEKIGIDTFNMYTAQQCKGMEFENVCVLNILSGKADIFDKIWMNKKIKDATLHYNFNLYYVAITRARYNLILVEDKNIKMFNNILKSMDNIEHITNVEQIDLTIDNSAIKFYNKGKELIDKGMYEKGKRYLKRCLTSTKLEELGIEKVFIMMNVCNIYLQNTTDEVLANRFEDEKIYDYAFKHYRLTNNYKKMALMKLLLKEYDKFATILAENEIDIFDLYKMDKKYNYVLESFIDSKINTLKVLTGDMKFLVNEVHGKIEKINFKIGE